jgi:anion-transporting  ArsA/GET3 family ATPase
MPLALALACRPHDTCDVQWGDVLSPGLLVVTGKGGTGKSTLAAALALAASAQGLRTLLAEVEGRGEIHRSLDVPDPGLVPSHTRWGFDVLSITPREAVLEYLRRNAGLRRLPLTLLRSRALDQVVSATPGLRDLLALGVLNEMLEVLPAAAGPRGGETRYSLVVVDGPPTGQIASFLSAPATFAELIRTSRIRRQAGAIEKMLRTHARVIIVAVPEEMAVAETLESAPAIRETGVRLIAVIANRVLPGADGVDAIPSPESAAARAGEAGLSLSDEVAADLVAAARTREGRRRIQAGFLERLAAAAPVLTIPDVAGSEIDDPVFEVAASIRGEPTIRRTIGRPRGARRPVPGEPERTTLEESLGNARIVVVCGSGGSGKTTVSAAVATHMARAGHRTVLLTVDPAKRLASALGLPQVAGERTTVPVGPGVSMDAMQLDTKRTFDELIDRIALNPRGRERILANPVYGRLSDTLGGTHEYMAMERLYQLAQDPSNERIVIDTPPTRSALAFLDAPNRMTDFLGGQFLRWIMWPSAQTGRAAAAVTRFGASAFRRTIGRVLGAETLGDLVEFLAAFQGLYGGFKERAAKVLALMGSSECAFVVVAAPAGVSLEEAGYFVDRLAAEGMGAAAVVANRWHGAVRRLPPGAAKAAANLDSGGAELRALAEAIRDRLWEIRRAERESEGLALFASASEVPVVLLPELERDVLDLPDLDTVAVYLFGGGPGAAGDGGAKRDARGNAPGRRSRI